MLLGKGRDFRIVTERITLRLPRKSDFAQWHALRENSREFLLPWEPSWTPDSLTRKGFLHRVRWAKDMITQDLAWPLFLERHDDQAVLGAITLDNIRKGPVQAGTLGYWVGECYARQGYMSEVVPAIVHRAFIQLGLSRIESACLPENKPSRRLLEKSGFKYEGVAQSYLQINGRWRNHVLYANLRHDRRGRVI